MGKRVDQRPNLTDVLNMLDQIIALFNDGKLTVEDHNGDNYFVDKVYEVKGRAGGIKILVFDAEKQEISKNLEELKRGNKEYESEYDQLKQEISNLEDDLQASEEEHEDYLQKIDSALEYAESILEITTSSRHSYDRINEIAEIIQEKISDLEGEKKYWANGWKEETKKGDKFYDIIKEIARTLKIEDWTTDTILEKIAERFSPTEEEHKLLKERIK